MKRTWNLDGLRKSAKARRDETQPSSRQKSRSTVSKADLEQCAVCNKTRWFHRQPQSWRADDGHAFSEMG
jgi:hypothetical protein